MRIRFISIDAAKVSIRRANIRIADIRRCTLLRIGGYRLRRYSPYVTSRYARFTERETGRSD
jgi:hypothetical protein